MEQLYNNHYLNSDEPRALIYQNCGAGSHYADTKNLLLETTAAERPGEDRENLQLMKMEENRERHRRVTQIEARAEKGKQI